MPCLGISSHFPTFWGVSAAINQVCVWSAFIPGEAPSIKDCRRDVYLIVAEEEEEVVRKENEKRQRKEDEKKVEEVIKK
ncbi:hypothetical protein E2C01_074783 [Portunus trituberculatus]|uniref:Uncharacterized protein n=1 Tax=Portunus trituberculatus TaxID=210409 RepID=A0A5B7I493_PORTR|nr:hypothetical protein [Portunus trituberculatus]